MHIQQSLNYYHQFKESKLKDRFFKHKDVMALLSQLPAQFKVSLLGKSVGEKEIKLITWGNGATKVMLWSQMHGDEATGTMALFDLLNFLQGKHEEVKSIAANCTLYLIPMVNPDGAEKFTRRNAQQIDINRDYLATVSPEAQLLKQCRTALEPHFGFNLHDQNTLWSVSGTHKPATLSFLAPASDPLLGINETRKNAMLVIADIFKDLNPLLPKHIGLFDEDFEPRAFGDNFQQAGTATILIEAGGLYNDEEKQEIRKYYFAAILSGLMSISYKSYLQQSTANYFIIPKNNKQIFHILIKNIMMDGCSMSIGINYEEIVTPDKNSTTQSYTIADMGDLSFCSAYKQIDAEKLTIKGDIVFNKPANFKLLTNNKILLAFQNGKLI